MNDNSTIVIRSKTRDLLKRIGRKEQTYDQLINELIDRRENQKQLKDTLS